MVGSKDVYVIDAKTNDDTKENDDLIVIENALPKSREAPCTPPRPARPPNSSVLSPKSQTWLQIQKGFRSPGFSASVTQKALAQLEPQLDAKKRDRETRSKFAAREDCPCCRPYFDALGLSEEETSKRIQEVGKHRALHHLEKTPPRYWDLEMSRDSPKSTKNRSPAKPPVKKRRK